MTGKDTATPAFPGFYPEGPEFRAPEPTPPAQQHSLTSRLAAMDARRPAQSQRERVYRLLRARGQMGATDEEMQFHLGMNPSTQRPRRIELVDAGLVRPSGRTRRTRAGKHATVWVSAEGD